MCLPRVDRCGGMGGIAPASIRFPTEVLMSPIEWRGMMDVAPFEIFRSDILGLAVLQRAVSYLFLRSD